MRLPPFLQQLTRRERMLAMIVGGVFVALLNLLLWSWLLASTSTARAEVDRRKLTRNEQIAYLRDTDLWNKRAQWLRDHQPLYKGAADASALLDQLKQIAGKHNVLIENPAIGNGASTSSYQSVFASIETKSPWPPLVHFLYDVQSPDSFIVFENANIAVDPAEATQIRGKFKIARWYAPAMKPK